MAELSSSDREELSRIVGQALLTEASAAAMIEAVDVANAKDFFCKHWPSIKGVLKFLGDQLGGLGKIAVSALIAAGDFLHGRICA